MTDPFGMAFKDYYNGDKSSEIIIHCNKGDDDIVPVSYFFRSKELMPKTELMALDHCYGKVLDIGAGSGSHSLELIKNGFDVTSLDISPDFIEIMKLRGLKNVVHSDIFDFKDVKFDTLLLLMNGIGLVKSINGLPGFLEHAKSLLKKGGQIIFDSSDLLYLYEDDEGNYNINLNDEYYGEVEFVVEYNGIKGKAFNWLYIDYDNLSSIAAEAGFRSEKLYEDDHFNYLAKLF
jgi:SAM-dependent methyltransferase